MSQANSRLLIGGLLTCSLWMTAPAFSQQAKQPTPAKPQPKQTTAAPTAKPVQPKPAANQPTLAKPPMPAEVKAEPKTEAKEVAKPEAPTAPDSATYTLRYKFQPDETLRWRTEHRSYIRTTVKGVTATAESYTESVKVWKVSEIDADGNVTFENSVASVKMRQKHSGSSEIEFDSLTDTDPPPVFALAAESIGKPLAVIQMDSRGKVLRRESKQTTAQHESFDLAQLAMTLPENPVAIGEQWHDPQEYKVRGPDSTIHTIKARQVYKLDDVRNGLAIVKLETQILTPVGEPSIEAQLAQKETRGEVRFDIAAGRIVGQQYDLDKPVVNFSGPQSSLHCRTRFTEELLGDGEPTASR